VGGLGLSMAEFGRALEGHGLKTEANIIYKVVFISNIRGIKYDR